jgi:cation transport ATPase
MEYFLIFPFSFGVFSLYSLTMLSLTVLVLKNYGWKIFVGSWKNFRKYKLLNMETLITLGSVSASLMLIYLAIIYTLENFHLKPDLS